jgi:predicted Zn-dependent protease
MRFRATPSCFFGAKARAGAASVASGVLAALVGSVTAVLAGCVTVPETGRKAFLLTTPAEEAQLGEQAYREILSKERESRDPRWNAIVQRVGARIAAAANQPGFRWEFRVLESKEPNAFCLPGGKVAFYTGIFPVAGNEAAIAAIMGHEVAHATLRHGGQRMAAHLGTQIGLGVLGAILGGQNRDDRGLLLAALGAGATVGVILPFSRANETEADDVGLRYMARAGYDPREAPRLWARMAQLGGGGTPTFLSTHPSSTGRQQALTARLPKVMPLYEQSAKIGLGETF